MDWVVWILFVVTLAINLRALYRLLVDWKGMWTTLGETRKAYRDLDALPTVKTLNERDDAPVFIHIVPAYQEPHITDTLGVLLGSRYPLQKLRIIVATKEEEEVRPHPAMGGSTADIVRRFWAGLPAHAKPVLQQVAMPGVGRKAHQLNWALNSWVVRDVIRTTAADRVFVGVSDADSIPDLDVFRWIAREELAGRGARAYQGITLSLANFERLGLLERVCAAQQSSIFIRVSIARFINEAKRTRAAETICRGVAWAERIVRPLLDLLLLRSHICLGHNQFVRLDVLRSIGGFPTEGATEDSMLGYKLGERRLPVRVLPLLELNELPESREKIVNQNARWYNGALDDARYLWRAWRASPSFYNFAQAVRHTGGKVFEWPIAAVMYPVFGFLGGRLAYEYYDRPFLFWPALLIPGATLVVSIWVSGVEVQRVIERMAPFLPRAVEVRRQTWKAKFLGVFRCQTYWLLATRGAWRVIWTLLHGRTFIPTKTDRARAGSPRKRPGVSRA